VAGVFGQVHAFWQKKNVADAQKFAMDAQNGFKQVAEHAAAGRFDEASQALTAAQANCAGCHEAHRERAADGSWKIK
jgi:cytochrome c553